jgi:hypothetical protein
MSRILLIGALLAFGGCETVPQLGEPVVIRFTGEVTDSTSGAPSPGQRVEVRQLAPSGEFSMAEWEPVASTKTQETGRFDVEGTVLSTVISIRAGCGLASDYEELDLTEGEVPEEIEMQLSIDTQLSSCSSNDNSGE